MKQLSDSQKAKLEKLSNNSRGFIDEFKEFINRGSVMDLAVGVIIGGAFTTIVNSLVNDILMPVLSLIGGGFDFTNLVWHISLFGGEQTANIAYGNFIQNIINFLIVAFCIFVIVKILNDMRDRAEKLSKKKEAEAPAPTPAEDETIKLLKEIRDSLKK